MYIYAETVYSDRYGATMNIPEVQGEYQFVSQLGIQYTNHTNSS